LDTAAAFPRRRAATRVGSIVSVVCRIGATLAPDMPLHFAGSKVACVFAPPKLNYGEENMKNLLKRLWFETEGQDLTEYALLVALVSLGATAAMGNLAAGINDAFSSAVHSLTTAGS
jgi:Flp pilus assembly pilin Flp